MSTRSHVAFFEGTALASDKTKPTALIYRHCDGYPTGMLPDLVPFLRAFHKSRGLSDTDYASARCIQWLANIADKNMEEMNKKLKVDRDHSFDFLSYGFCPDGQYHLDVEYVYLVHGDGTLQVYSVNLWDQDKSKNVWELLGEKKIDSFKSDAEIEKWATKLEKKAER